MLDPCLLQCLQAHSVLPVISQPHMELHSCSAVFQMCRPPVAPRCVCPCLMKILRRCKPHHQQTPTSPGTIFQAQPVNSSFCSGISTNHSFSLGHPCPGGPLSDAFVGSGLEKPLPFVQEAVIPSGKWLSHPESGYPNQEVAIPSRKWLSRTTGWVTHSPPSQFCSSPATLPSVNVSFCLSPTARGQAGVGMPPRPIFPAEPAPLLGAGGGKPCIPHAAELQSVFTSAAWDVETPRACRHLRLAGGTSSSSFT